MPTSPDWLAGRLRQLRLAAGLDRKQVAEKAGVSEYAVRDIEQGLVYPRWDTVVAICDGLGCMPSDFMSDPGPMAPLKAGRPKEKLALTEEDVRVASAVSSDVFGSLAESAQKHGVELSEATASILGRKLGEAVAEIRAVNAPEPVKPKRPRGRPRKVKVKDGEQRPATDAEQHPPGAGQLEGQPEHGGAG